jgi:hypothetical protein
VVDSPAGERYKRTGEILPDSAIEEFRKFDSIFVGAIGHPDVKPGILEVGILLKTRFTLDHGRQTPDSKSRMRSYCTSGSLGVLGEKSLGLPELRIPSGAKARVDFAIFAARLKPCPFKTSTYSEVP